MAIARLAFQFLLVLFVAFVGIGLLLPDTVTVERDILIQAPPDRVFPHINGMHAFHAWSPWSDIDPDTVYSFSGPVVGVGSRMAWNSQHAEVGGGSQEIALSEPPRRVESELVFGDQGGGVARFLLEPENGGTRVRWQFETGFGWDLFGRYIGQFMDGMIGGNYAQGLARLKERVEAGTPAATANTNHVPNQ